MKMNKSFFTILSAIKQWRTALIVLFVSIIVIPHQVNCAPTLATDIINPEESYPLAGTPHESNLRVKRSGISDQRLAELETLLALKRMRDEHLKNRMVAFGLFDPEQIGRRRRRSSNEEYEPSFYEKLRKLDDHYNQLGEK